MNYLQVYNFIHQRLTPVEIKEVKEDDEPKQRFNPIECKTFEKLCTYYQYSKDTQVGLYWTKEIERTLICMIAVILSTNAKGGQLGLRVVGPGSSAKSILAECLSQSEKYVYPLDTFKGIITGWHSVTRSNMIAAKMNGRCCIVKEADALLKQPNLPQIESELKSGMGDGIIRTEYRTGKEIKIRSLFTMILCGTSVVRRMDDPSLGSRFLDIIIHDTETSTEQISLTAIDNSFKNIRSFFSPENNGEKTSIKPIILRAAPPTIGFLDGKVKQMEQGLQCKNLTITQKRRIYALAKFITYCRVQVGRRKEGTLEARPEKEIPARIAENLTRFALFIAITIFTPDRTNNIEINNKVFEVLREITLSTCYGFRLELILGLYKPSNRPERVSFLSLSAEQIANKINLNLSQTRTLLADCRELKMVDYEKKKEVVGKGRAAYKYTLTEEMQQLLREARL